MARYENILELEPNLNGEDLSIGIVMSRFNIEVGEGLLGACVEELMKQGVDAGNVVLVSVPGALEIPLALQKMALTDQFDALIALGAVIRGETYHFEVVSEQSTNGVATVQLDTGVPIANGILTTDTDDQALTRMSQKGAETARVAIEMANLQRTLDEMDQ